MLANLFRPKKFSQVIGQEVVVSNLQAQSKKDNFFHVYVLGGQYGGGKTTMARIIALAANCEHKDEDGNPCLECPSCKAILNGSTDIREIDGASNNGVDNIRSVIEDVKYMPVQLKRKVYIIDEVHMLSTGAFNALLKTLEEPEDYVIFVLCTTEVQKIPATVLSRSAVYTFKPVESAVLAEHVKRISAQINVPIEDEAAYLIGRNADGSVRNALSLLEQAKDMGPVTVDTVNRMLGMGNPSTLFQLFQGMLDGDLKRILSLTEAAIANGTDAVQLVTALMSICADVISAHYVGMDYIRGSGQYQTHIKDISNTVNITRCEELVSLLLNLRTELYKAPGKTTLLCGVISIFNHKEFALCEVDNRISELKHKIELLEKELKDNNIQNNSVSKLPEEVRTDYSCVAKESETVDYKEEECPSKEANYSNSEDCNEVKPEIEEKYADSIVKGSIEDKLSEPKDVNTIFEMFDSVLSIPFPKKKEEPEGQKVFLKSCLDKIRNDSTVLDTAIMECCEEKVTEQGYMYYTKNKDVYRIIQKYAQVYGIPIPIILLSDEVQKNTHVSKKEEIGYYGDY